MDKIRTAGMQLIESALSVVGVRTVEEPPHSVEPMIDGVEIRRYSQRIAAETTVSSAEVAARNNGFRRLAAYIFGANHRDETIAMTAPVGQQSEHGRGQKIAMTAPVAQSGDDQAWVIRFYMPAQWTMQTLPVPNDDRVRLVAVPPETVAVLRFTGDRGPDSVATRTARTPGDAARGRVRTRRRTDRVVLRSAVDDPVSTTKRDRHPRRGVSRRCATALNPSGDGIVDQKVDLLDC